MHAPCQLTCYVPINRPDGANCQPNGLDCVSAGTFDTEDMCDIEDCDICLADLYRLRV